MNSHKMFEGKLKSFKNWLICAKHTIFVIDLSRQGKLPEHLRQKNLKIFLSVFRNWKFYPQESRDWNLHPWTNRQSEPQET